MVIKKQQKFSFMLPNTCSCFLTILKYTTPQAPAAAAVAAADSPTEGWAREGCQRLQPVHANL